MTLNTHDSTHCMTPPIAWPVVGPVKTPLTEKSGNYCLWLMPCGSNIVMSKENGGSFLYLQLELFYLQWSFFACSPSRCFLDTLCLCKQGSSIASKKARTASKKAQAASKKAPKHNCKQRSSTLRRELPTVSKKAASKIRQSLHTSDV